MSGRHGATAGRASWSLVDQVVSSGTNVLATVLAARALSPTDFGAYAAAAVSFTLGLVAIRALVFEAGLVRAEQAGDRLFAVVASGACVVALVPMVLVAAAAAVARGAAGQGLLVFAVCLPGLAVQDAWRYVAFARRTPRAALAADLVWLAGMVGAFALLSALDDGGSPALAVGAWLVPGALTGLGLLVVRRTWPRLADGVSWIRRNADLGGRYLLESFSTLGVLQVGMYLLVFVSGMPALGAARAGFAVFGPLQVLHVGVTVTLVPDGRRLAQRSPTRLTWLLAVVSLGFLVSTAAVAAVLLLLPDPAGRALFGATWANARDVIWPACFMTVGGSLLAGPVMGLRALERAADILRVRLVTAPVSLALAAFGATVGDAGGMIWGMTGGTMLAAAMTWARLRGVLVHDAAEGQGAGP